MTSPELDTELHTGPLEQARRLAESGDLEAAAEIFTQLAADPDGRDRAQAAVGLAVVLEERGDLEGARSAARTALATGHPEYAAQAACHLARGFERDGQDEQARGAWQAVLGVGTAAYLPLAHLALARLADGEEEAERELRAAISVGDPELSCTAAQELAELLLDRGEPGEAAAVLVETLPLAQGAHAGRLRVLLGIAHLELACAEFAGVVEDAARGEGAEAESTSLAIELLARTLPLRGRADDAERVWAYGLAHADEELAEQVRLRLDRGELSSGA
ncbi:tetratricopeptide repeat protein [Nonomuraea dietziae]|uniref:tetratricopeptide repeat protein n=1 Tax=Nonomuraea dietziae TaxID=65515 RepID=UPI0033C6F53D